MADGYLVRCRTCGWTRGPFTGTVWKTPREHASQAQGGHHAHHDDHETEVVEYDGL